MTKPHESDDRIDLAALRARLAEARGPQYWRSLEQLADSPEFHAWAGREFPNESQALLDPASRRQFLRLMAGSIALAGVSGCAYQPPEHIVPYVEQPERVQPGQELFFATAMPMAGAGVGLLVESREGRPIKVEGNPAHPASLGATDPIAQASILTLYDPDRSQVVLRNGRISTWDDFLTAVIARRARWARDGGAGLRLLTQSVASPTLEGLFGRLLEEFPRAKIHAYEAVNRDQARAGARLAFGEDVEAVYKLEGAKVILTLDADLFGSGPARLVHARRFADNRDPDGTGAMNRLYAVECTPTTTGSSADHRLPVRASRLVDVAHALARHLGVAGAREDRANRVAEHDRWLAAAARDLQANKGACLVACGDHLPAEAHALVHAINDALGNAGKTVAYYPPIAYGRDDDRGQAESLRALVGEIRSGAVDTLMILGGNPVYDAPADLDFAGALDQVQFSAHLGLYEDETSERCLWHLPEAHYLETWGDVRAFDGTATIQQPLIEPLYGSKPACEVVAAITGRSEGNPREIVRDAWREKLGEGGDFEAAWRKAVHDGMVAGTASEPRAVSIQPLNLPAPGAESAGLDLVMPPDPNVWDGRFANNAWLQELPKPLTRLTWDNAALMAPETAERLGVSTRDVVVLTVGERAVRAAAWVMPGQAPETVTLHLGYGRRRAGRVGTGLGFDAYALRTAANPWLATGLSVTPAGSTYPLAATQTHRSLEGRDIVRSATLAEYKADPHFARTHEQEVAGELNLYPRWEYNDHAWGMSIDLNRCIGCNACVTACQSENNIPVVGKEGVLQSREMHWLEIDTYYEGDPADPQTYYQPRACMHCEQAPCELVCPVEATLHDHEGLNLMVYNRCVGTRFCSNNCPYKVRHFNFLEYNGDTPEVLKLRANPEVTIRSRGVMEKCTYCLQRINAAKQAADVEGRPVRTDEVVTACQGACPTRAIVFGDINDPESQVAKLKARPTSYGMLAELNTLPRTTYLAKVWNPNPELATESRDVDRAH